MTDTTQLYGLTALPADQAAVKPRTTTPAAVAIDSLVPPTTALATRVAVYAKSKLDADTYRHSLRVYSYGCTIARECFPEFHLEPGSTLEETWFLTAMLHDIGTSDEALGGTRLSFEFWGGIHALQLLQDPEITGAGEGEGIAPREQAESVAEAIFRHQDVQEKGKITLITRLIHLGTLLDNIGADAELVSEKTIEDVNGRYPRKGWSGCFRSTVEKEKRIKPYAMVSRIEKFEDAISKNGGEAGLMARWE
jgi:cyanamide hydratase